MATPGVLGSSINSGSGGVAVPSILRDIARCFCILAVIASRLGIFLYPILFLGCSGNGRGTLTVPSEDTPFSSFRASSFSLVSGSPPSGAGVALVVVVWLCCEVALNAGDVDRVLGGFTVMESAMEAVVLTLAVDPVRREEATSLGRDADVVLA